MTEPPEDDGALLSTDWMLDTVGASTVREVVPVLAKKSPEVFV